MECLSGDFNKLNGSLFILTVAQRRCRERETGDETANRAARPAVYPTASIGKTKGITINLWEKAFVTVHQWGVQLQISMDTYPRGPCTDSYHHITGHNGPTATVLPQNIQEDTFF